MEEQGALVYASFARRALARGLDSCVMLAPFAALYAADALAGFPVRYKDYAPWVSPRSPEVFMYYDPPGILILLAAFKLLVAYPYFALTESSPLQATPGKYALGLKVTDLEGRRVSFGRASARHFLKFVSNTLFMLGYLVSFSERRQTWHDFVSKTLVVKRRPRPSEVSGRWTSRWMFGRAGATARGGEVVADGPAEEWPRYECMFCHARSDEKPPGCPNCGALFGYAERRAVRGLQVMGGVVFGFVGAGLLCMAGWLTFSVASGDASVDSWVVWPILYGLGLLFFAGGVSALAGRNWLLRWLLVAFGGLRGGPALRGRRK
ncbi:MAG TPA: RDD family protein [Pyrinomonadaceae bacterium]|jgi:uncharacterized RDD family membrane protein YckC|nr:RDD family protein [Pyrinomonadaceae bacterium]